MLSHSPHAADKGVSAKAGSVADPAINLLNTDPKKLKTACETLTARAYGDSKDKGKNETSTALIARFSRPLQAMTVAAQIRMSIQAAYQALHDHPVEFNLTKTTDSQRVKEQRAVFFDNLREDLFLLDKLAQRAIDRITLISSMSETTPHTVYLLWHSLDEAEKQHALRYEAKANALIQLFNKKAQATLKTQFDRHLKLLTGLYPFKNALAQLDDIGLYVYRLNQHVTSRGRALIFKEGWQQEEKGLPSIAGFAEACKDYRNQFKKIILLRNLNKCTAFETIRSLYDILQLKKSPEFTTLFSADAPPKALDNILAWLTRAIEGVTKPPSHKVLPALAQHGPALLEKLGLPANTPLTVKDNIDDEDNILAFFSHVKSEQLLKDALSHAETLALSIIKQTKSFQVIQELSPEAFMNSFAEPSLSHEEIVARDKKRLYEREQARRAEQAEQEAKAQQFAFTEQLKKENEAKQNTAKAAKKEVLLKKIGALSGQQRKHLAAFLDSKQDLHKTFDEETICTLFIELGVLEKTSGGYKIQNTYEAIASTHRARDGLLDGNFCQDLRKILTDLGISECNLGDSLRASY